MITVLHGSYSEASRREFMRRKEEAKNKEIRTLDGRSLDGAGLTQALESQSMFGGDTIVFIENLFGKLGRKVKLIEQLCQILVRAGSSVDIVLWENKELGVTVVKSLPGADVQQFKIPSVIFQILDGLAPSGSSHVLSLYTTLVQTEAPELIFSMINRRVRQLIQIRDGVVPEGMQGWQASRLTRQAKLFTIGTLLGMYKRLLSMECSIKNGSSPFTLAQLTEQFIIDL